ncbi:LysE family translocator [Puniceibacterium sediminis]|uniref:Threonine/homoserine/homoserine lactone efflux protein n=1 Tax=Puniceibacterium sediminis TaxID=1608407 RepID=A0A238Y6M2_9RHOB|nr:LysE family translocator [Puniceibacterium sediminis]SNR66757.1 Threonine/homoserine/homoserine lactone efflux protein [Puniceibacterium sediminis]
MPQFDTILAVILAGLALSATPGPSMLYVLSRSVGQSRAAGLASALGLGLGGILLAVATAMGLAATFTEFSELVVALRYIGSAYLVWLGVGMIRDSRTSVPVAIKAQKVVPSSFRTIIYQGVLIELLNPKTVLFFALFLPPFIDTTSGQATETSVQIQLLTLGVLVPLTAIPSDIFVAYMGGTMTQVLKRQEIFGKFLAWIGGLTLIAIAINLHLEFI